MLGGIDLHSGFFQQGQCHHTVDLDVIDQQNARMVNGREVMVAATVGRLMRAAVSVQIETFQNAVMQCRAVYRLGQDMFQAGTVTEDGQFFVTAGSHHQDGRNIGFHTAVDIACGFNTVHAGHQPVEQD